MTNLIGLLVSWLFGKSVPAKIVLAVVSIATAGIAFFALKAAYDARKRREGAAEVIDKLKTDSRMREEKMKRAPKPEDDDEVQRMLEQGRG